MAGLLKRKLLNNRNMHQNLKFKRGFTWRHHFDEWWDRRPHEWKVRLFVFAGLMVVAGMMVLLLWAQRSMERDELITEAKKLHQKRIQGVDSQIASEVPVQSPPMIPQSEVLEVRAGE